MMVDQLWLWVLNDNTSVTAFPESQDVKISSANLLNPIIKDLRTALPAQTIKSVNGILALIIAKCTVVFHQHDIPGDLALFPILREFHWYGEKRAI